MWTDHDDYNEETDMLLFMALCDTEDDSQPTGSCLMFMIGLIGIAALPILTIAGLIS